MAIEITGGVYSAPQWLMVNGGLSLSFWTGDILSGLLTAMSSPGYSGGGINVYGFPKIGNNAVDSMIECGTYNYFAGWMRVGRGYNPATGASLGSFIFAQWSSNGVVWSDVQASTIPNAPALIGVCKMANAKFCLAWNPDADRNKLVLAVGNNGLTFFNSYTVRSGLGTTPVFAGDYKGGGPQYPSIIERSDGKLLIAYSVFKENMAVSVVTVP